MQIVRRYIQLASLICMASAVGICNGKEHTQEYTWTVVPQFANTIIHRDWHPFLIELEKQTGYRFKLRLHDSFHNFESAFQRGEPDFAYMNPYHAVMARRSQSYEPMIKSGDRLLTGILVARRDGQIRDVSQLNGKQIAFPSPIAFAASLYMRARLTEVEKIKFSATYAGTHGNSYRKALLGQVLAAGTVESVLSKEREEIRKLLRVIYKAPSTAPHPIVVHPRVSKAIQDKVASAIKSFSKSAEGRILLKNTLLTKPTDAVYETDYQELEFLELDYYINNYQ